MLPDKWSFSEKIQSEYEFPDHGLMLDKLDHVFYKVDPAFEEDNSRAYDGESLLLDHYGYPCKCTMLAFYVAIADRIVYALLDSEAEMSKHDALAMLLMNSGFQLGRWVDAYIRYREGVRDTMLKYNVNVINKREYTDSRRLFDIDPNWAQTVPVYTQMQAWLEKVMP